jgi:dihydrolipoamide dehydrogenase
MIEKFFKCRLLRLIDNGPVTRIVIIGGGPAGYEAALVAAQLDADVTVVEAAGAGGACVLDDCVPSKTFIASSEVVTGYRDTEQFGVHSDGLEAITVDAVAVHARVKRLAMAASSGSLKTRGIISRFPL